MDMKISASGSGVPPSGEASSWRRATGIYSPGGPAPYFQGTTEPQPADTLGTEPCDTSWSADDKILWFREKFRPHFDKWIISRIDRLLASDPLVGFIFMACVIDYLAGFRYPVERTTETEYKAFISRYFPKEPNGDERYDSDELYNSLRNGLVHSFTIKGQKYTLTDKRPELHLKKAGNNQINLNAEDFRCDLIKAKDDYFNAVERGGELLDNAISHYCKQGFISIVELQFR